MELSRRLLVVATVAALVLFGGYTAHRNTDLPLVLEPAPELSPVKRFLVESQLSDDEREGGEGGAIASPPPTQVDADRSRAVAGSAAERFQRVWYPWEKNKSVESVAARAVGGSRVWVSCAYNKGRSGHELKDVATTFILAVWLGWTPCAQGWWTSKSVGMFNAAAGLVRCPVNRGGKLEPGSSLVGPIGLPGGVRTVRVVRFQRTSYDGLDDEGVRALRQAVSGAVGTAAPDEAILLYLTGSTRVHMDQVYSWARSKPDAVPVTVFADVRRTLQARLFAQLWSTGNATAAVVTGELPPPPLPAYLAGILDVNCTAVERCELTSPSATSGATTQAAMGTKQLQPHDRLSHAPHGGEIVVAIHLRRGDIAAGMAEGEWTSKEFAQRLVVQLHAALDACACALEIHVYTEKSGASDLQRAPPISGVTKIWSGGESHSFFSHSETD
jgi:hypothetical protein